MNSHFKHFSKSALAIVLTVCMLISCMTVGIIATDAAYPDSESVGADADFYLRGDIHGNSHWDDNNWHMTKSGDYYYYIIDAYNNDYYKFYDAGNAKTYGPSGSDAEVQVDSVSVAGAENGNYAFQLKGNNGKYIIWFKPSSKKTWIVSYDLYLDGYINGTNMSGSGGHQMLPSASDPTIFHTTLTCSTDDQYFAIYADTSNRYYNYTYSNLADGTWSGDYSTGADATYMAGDGYKLQAAGVDQKTIHVYWSTRDRHLMWSETELTPKYYLHYAQSDSGMSSATVVELVRNASTGKYEYTLRDWGKTTLNVNVDHNSTNVTNSKTLSSITVTANTGLSVDEPEPKKWGEGYYRAQYGVSPTPQDITFSYNPDTDILNATGSLQKYEITAGGSSSDYKLKATNGSTQISNYGTTRSAEYNDGTTVNVTITPTDPNKKVTAISADTNDVSAVTDNGNGTYSATVTVSADATITATLDDKVRYTVTYSDGSHGTVSADVASGTSVLEGTTVTFTAHPEDGYVFTGWTGISETLNPASHVVTGNLIVSATFGVEGYRLYDKTANTTTDMKALPSGLYITRTKMTKNNLFTVKRTADGYYLREGNSGGAYSWHAGWTTAVNAEGKWASGASNSDDDYYKITDDTKFYIVYDPHTDKIWPSTESDGLVPVKIYVKDGTVRQNNNSTPFTCTAQYGESTITSPSSGLAITDPYQTDDSISGQVKVITLQPAEYRNGLDITIRTAVVNQYSAYYVAGFDVTDMLTQGVVRQEFSDEGDKAELSQNGYSNKDAYKKIHGTDNSNLAYNEFTLKLEGYTQPAIEVTPLYFKRSDKSADFVRFYATDFTGDVKKNWGGTLAVYPYIEDGYNPFGNYPGQPMINEAGRYYVDIPTKDDNDTPMQGLTMNNYVWDRVHSDVFYGTTGIGVNEIHKTISPKNYQTYDFNEFEVINRIFQSDPDLADEDIIFSFKYKNEKSLDDSNLGKSTYYKESANASATNAYDYRNGFNTLETTDTQYQFENLTDFYNNRVDIFNQLVDTQANATKKNYNPIVIVSNGYDYSKVGKYATAWALYKPVDVDGKVAWTGDVDHYELFEVMGGQGRSEKDYPGESYLIDPEYAERIKCKYGDSNKLSEYRAAFSEKYPGADDVPSHILDCEGVPVIITYEYEGYSKSSNLDLERVGNGDGQPGHRSDGRWYYSRSDQSLMAHTKIAIYNPAKKTYTLDNYQEGIDFDFDDPTYNKTLHTGSSTGIQAYFTNTNLVKSDTIGDYQNESGNTEACALSNGKDTFDMTTVGDPNGNYIFMGWYLYNGTDYILCTEDASYSTEAKANDIFVAVYKRITAGTLNISHFIHPDSQCGANCTVSVGVYDDHDRLLENLTPQAVSAVTVTGKYIKAGSDNKIKITLSTEKTYAASEFEDFFEKITASDAFTRLTAGAASELGVNATVAIDKEHESTTATIEFPISELFTYDPDTEEDVQTVKTMPFFSKLNITAKNFTISKKILNDMASTEDYTISINTKKTLDKNETAVAYKGAYTIVHASGVADTEVAADASRTSCDVRIKKNDEIKIAVTADTVFEITELNPEVTKFHYNHTEVDNEEVTQDEANTLFKLDNGVLLTVASTDTDKKVDICNKARGYKLQYFYHGYLTRYSNVPKEGDGQSYTITGLFTEADYNNTIQLEQVNGEYQVQFQSDALRKSFITDRAPFQDNFLMKLEWNPVFEVVSEGDVINSSMTYRKASIGEELLLTTKADEDTDRTAYVYFSLPYAFGEDLAPVESTEDDNKVLKTDPRIYNCSTQYGHWYTTDGNYECSEDDAKFVTAPTEIYQKGGDGSYTKYLFRYWTMATVSSGSGRNHALRVSEEYKRCYYHKFNMTFYQDTIVTPYYAPEGEEEVQLTPSQIEAGDTAGGTGINITFLENSRNQWNDNGGVEQEAHASADKKNSGDRVYCDFLLSFAHNGSRLQSYVGKTKTEEKEEEGETVQVQTYLPYKIDDEELFYSGGIIIEKVADAEEITDVSQIKTQAEYRSMYGYDDLDTDMTTYINNGFTGNPNVIITETFSSAAFDNKNQLEYSTSFANRKHGKLSEVRPYKEYVYRAYTYLKDYNGSTATEDNLKWDGEAVKAEELSAIRSHTGKLIKVSKPVYFTIYEMASIQDGTTYSGQGES